MFEKEHNVRTYFYATLKSLQLLQLIISYNIIRCSSYACDGMF